MGIDGIDVLKPDNNLPPFKACENIHKHGPHEWGMRGKIWYCQGIEAEI
jgi:hypothetical protein